MLTPLQRYLLGMFEDDYYGLWELDWTFNSQYPAMEPHERIGSVKSLFEDGLMSLYLRKDLGDHSEAIEADTAVGLVSDYKNWEAPIVEGTPKFVFTTSEKGIRLLQGHG